jgi:hypothetical protein
MPHGPDNRNVFHRDQHPAPADTPCDTRIARLAPVHAHFLNKGASVGFGPGAARDELDEIRKHSGNAHTIAPIREKQSALSRAAAKGGKPDFPGWFKAYGEFFNSKENPVKTARSTVGVAALVRPDWLLEIEAVAVWPEKKQ